MRLLFVCSGNTCRSPLAVAAWQAFTPVWAREWQNNVRLALERVEASSAGLAAHNGAQAAHYSQIIAREWGANLSEHRARLLLPKMVQNADLVVTMSADQATIVREHFRIDDSRVKVLGDYAAKAGGAVAEASRLDPLWGRDKLSVLLADMGGRNDILDPFGGSLEAYQACAEHIRRSVEGLARVLAGIA